MTRAKAARIIGQAMDGGKPAGLAEALKLCGISREEFEICRVGALKVTSPQIWDLASTEIEARQIHGLDSDVDYDRVDGR